MRFATTLAACLLALPLAAAGSDCGEPPERLWDLPDGTSASKEEMLEGQAQVKGYMEKAQAYVDCIDAAEEETMKQLPSMEDSKRKYHIKRLEQARRQRNQVVENMQAVAEDFNREIDLFQQQAGGDS